MKCSGSYSSLFLEEPDCEIKPQNENGNKVQVVKKGVYHLLSIVGRDYCIVGLILKLETLTLNTSLLQ